MKGLFKLFRFFLLIVPFAWEASAFSRYCVSHEVVPTSRSLLSQAKRFSSVLHKKVYSEDDLVSFPSLNTPVEKWPAKQQSEVFVPPAGKHYRHNFYNMNLYEPAREVLGEINFQKITSSRSNETYLFPGKNCPKLVRDFNFLPFSASGSLWAYRTEQDYQDNLPCWSGSASMLTPYCAITAAHCLMTHEAASMQPLLYAFVLHHYGEIFATKRKCVLFEVPINWKNLALMGKRPSPRDDYGIVFFLPISDCKYDVLKIKRKTESLINRQIQVTGYPGDSVELRARKLWPDNLSSKRFQYLWSSLNGLPFVTRRFIYRKLDIIGFLEDNKYAGCVMFSSSGKVIGENDGMISYDANTFPGQSGGNGVEEIILSHKSGRKDEKGMLDFLHTLGGQAPSQGNSGVKVEGAVSSQILEWVKEKKESVDYELAAPLRKGKNIPAFDIEKLIEDMVKGGVIIEDIYKYSQISKKDVDAIIKKITDKKR